VKRHIENEQTRLRHLIGILKIDGNLSEGDAEKAATDD